MSYSNILYYKSLAVGYGSTADRYSNLSKDLTRKANDYQSKYNSLVKLVDSWREEQSSSIVVLNGELQDKYMNTVKSNDTAWSCLLESYKIGIRKIRYAADEASRISKEYNRLKINARAEANRLVEVQNGYESVDNRNYW